MFNFPCPSSYECVTTEKALKRWVAKLEGVKAFSFDTESSGVDPMSCELRGVSLGLLNKNHEPEACYIPLTHRTDRPQLSKAEVFKALRPSIRDPKKRTVFHNAVYDVVVLHRHGLTGLKNVHDTMLQSYVLTAKKDLLGHGMDHLCKAYFDYDTIRFQDVVLTDLGMEEFGDVGFEEATAYAGEDSAVTIAMFDHFSNLLREEGLWELYANEDRKLVPVIAQMKLDGAAIDVKFLYERTVEWTAAQEKSFKTITKIAGKEINLSSPKKLSEYLFSELKLTSHVETDNGGESTGKEALEAIVDEHKVVKPILEYKKIEKLLSTFGAPLIAKADPEKHTIHTNFNLTSTSTGRLSSSDPNLQNIPIRTKEGALIRQAFVARDKNRLIMSLDYSQIEVRILAHITRDKTLIGAFERGEDAHATTAAMMWGKTPEYYLDKENPEAEFKRRAAKSVTFGIIYGMTEYGLSHQLKVDPLEAIDFIERYHERMPTVQPWKDETVEFAKAHKYVETLFGRRIHVPRINWGGGVGRGEERLATNAPIQGSSADITRRAMVRIPPALRTAGLDCKMIMQVHDELVFDVLGDHAEDALTVCRKVMETCADDVVKWRVPILVEGKAAANWGEAH